MGDRASSLGGNVLNAARPEHGSLRYAGTGSNSTGAFWLFVAIGHDQATKPFRGHLPVDEEGYLIVEPGSTRTTMPGVFAAGDCVDKVYRQAVTAAGMGCMAGCWLASSVDARSSVHAGSLGQGCSFSCCCCWLDSRMSLVLMLRVFMLLEKST